MKMLKKVLENMENLENIIEKTAPHGSGIDYDYNSIRVEHYSRDNQNKVIFENAYHCMDENGFYDGIIPFRVVIGSDLTPVIRFVKLNNAGRYRVTKYYIREYLEDVYACWVDENEEMLEILAKIL